MSKKASRKERKSIVNYNNFNQLGLYNFKPKFKTYATCWSQMLESVVLSLTHQTGGAFGC
jgi:hypothetical protein